MSPSRKCILVIDDEADNAGANQYPTKPVSYRELHRAVEEAIRVPD